MTLYRVSLQKKIQFKQYKIWYYSGIIICGTPCKISWRIVSMVKGYKDKNIIKEKSISLLHKYEYLIFYRYWGDMEIILEEAVLFSSKQSSK